MVRDEIQIKAERDYAIEVAVEKAEAKKQVEIARAMKSQGISIQVISDCSGLSIETIERM